MKKICNVEGCVHPVRAKGYCQKHYQNARRNGGKPVSTRPNVKSREPKVCSDKGCGNFVYAKGYCRMHYTRLLRNGTTDLKRHSSHGKTKGQGGK